MWAHRHGAGHSRGVHMKMNMGITSVVPAIIMAAITGCVSSHPDADQHTRALSMLPQSNDRYQCGPSTLASVLAFHGTSVPEDVISKAIYSPTANGVILHDMAWFARKQGFRADLHSGSVNDLKRSVDERQPPIVLLDYGVAGFRKPHFTAITGVSEEGVFQLGNKRAADFVRMDLFTRLWKRAGNHYLVITPAESPLR